MMIRDELKPRRQPYYGSYGEDDVAVPEYDGDDDGVETEPEEETARVYDFGKYGRFHSDDDGRVDPGEWYESLADNVKPAFDNAFREATGYGIDTWQAMTEQGYRADISLGQVTAITKTMTNPTSKLESNPVDTLRQAGKDSNTGVESSHYIQQKFSSPFMEPVQNGIDSLLAKQGLDETTYLLLSEKDMLPSLPLSVQSELDELFLRKAMEIDVWNNYLSVVENQPDYYGQEMKVVDHPEYGRLIWVPSESVGITPADGYLGALTDGIAEIIPVYSMTPSRKNVLYKYLDARLPVERNRITDEDIAPLEYRAEKEFLDLVNAETAMPFGLDDYNTFHHYKSQNPEIHWIVHGLLDLYDPGMPWQRK